MKLTLEQAIAKANERAAGGVESWVGYSKRKASYTVWARAIPEPVYHIDAADVDEEEDEFDGLTVCPVCATKLQQVDQGDDDTWSGVCWPCNTVWNWDDEGYWEAER